MWKKRLSQIYSTPGESGAFSSMEKLYKILRKEGYAQVKQKDVQDWLDNQYSHVIHRHRLLKFPRNPIIAQYPDHNWQADILFLPDIASFNDNKPCILICIDVVSRFAWGEPIRTKKGVDTSRAFEKILTRSFRCPEKLQTDKGTEFYNKDFQSVMKKHGIKLYSTASDKKAAIAERCIKEIKKLVYRYLSSYQTNRYIDRFQELMDTYNSTAHRTIGMAPKDVNESTLSTVLNKLYGHLWSSDTDRIRPKFAVGAKVRISLSTKFFSKGYKGFWTAETFIINAVKRYHPCIMYQLKDDEGEIIKGLFYQEELQAVRSGSERFTRVKKIIRKRFIKGKLWYQVQWEGEPDSMKRWVQADSLYSE
jgi:hypothetical protein